MSGHVRRFARCAWPSALATLATACAAGGSAGTSAFETRAASPDGTRARELAADLFAHAEHVRDAARAADDAEAARDHDERALILLEASIVEADRIALDRRRAEVERRIERAVAMHAHAERERRALVQRIERLEAARVAHREAERVLALAEIDEARRLPKEARERVHREAASALWRRAALVLAAATALGLDPAVRGDVQAMLDAVSEAEAKKGGAREALVRSERALEAAERALGEARRAAPGPSPEETASLVAAASERGLAVERVERGIALRLTDAFAAGSARPTLAGLRAIEQLAALVRAHPHGPVTIEAFAERAGKAGARLAAARSRRVAAGLADAGDRVRVEPGTHDLVAADGAVQAVFGAYAQPAAPAAQ